MKRVVVSSLLMAVVLGFGSTAQMAEASSSLLVSGSLTGSDMTWGAYSSRSEALVSPTSNLSLWVDSHASGPHAIASATLLGDSAMASTAADVVAVAASVRDSLGFDLARASAFQQRQFTASGSGVLVFNVDFTYLQNLSPYENEKAAVETWVSLELWRTNGPPMDFAAFGESNRLQPGDTGSFGGAGMLTASSYFAAGQQGYIRFSVYGQIIEAVPVPGALFLGGVGTGLIIWMRRRRVL